MPDVPGSAALRGGGLLLLVAGLAAADTAGATGWTGGWDLIHLHSKIEISGRVLHDHGDSLSIDVGFDTVEFAKERIDGITPHGGSRPLRREDVPVEILRAGQPSLQAWTGSAGLLWGIHVGAVGTATSFTDSTAPGQQQVDYDQRLGVDRQPGGYLRLTRQLEGSAYALGAQFAAMSASGDAIALRIWSLEAVATRRLDSAGPAHWSASLAAGPALGSLTRTYELADAAGNALAATTVDAQLLGFVLRAEAGPEWRCGAWNLGAVVGGSWTRLAGSADWNAGGGRFAGSDDITCSALALYAGATMARSW